MESGGRTNVRILRVWAQIGVMISDCVSGETSGPPAESEYAVEYVFPGGNNPIFLSIQKQSGIQEWPLELIIDENGKKSAKQFSIRQDVSLQVR